MIASAEALGARVRAAARGEIGVLAIGFNETVSWGTVIPRTICEFRCRHSNVSLTMQPMLSVDQVEAPRRHRIDGGFLFNRDTAGIELRGVPVLVDRVLLAVPASSLWARRPPARLAELADEPFVWVPRHVALPYCDAVVRHCRDAGLVLRVVQESMDGSALLSLVAVGIGLSFVPASARARCPQDVALVRVPDLRLHLTLEFVWRAAGSR